LFCVGLRGGVGGRCEKGVAVVGWRQRITCERVAMGLWVDEGNGVGGVCVRVVVCERGGVSCCSAMQLTPLLLYPQMLGLGGIIPRPQLQKALWRTSGARDRLLI
jgi:hypothetical protein